MAFHKLRNSSIWSSYIWFNE